MITLAVAFIAPSYLRAQAVGQILGTIKDPTGAVVPNAKITVLQEGTGVTRSTISTSSGTCSLPNLPVGTYNVSVGARGFKKASLTKVTVDVSQQREVDFTLVLAGTRQQVAAWPGLLMTRRLREAVFTASSS